MRQEVLFLLVLIYSYVCKQLTTDHTHQVRLLDVWGSAHLQRERMGGYTRNRFKWFWVRCEVYRDRSKEYFFLYHILIFEPYKYMLIHTKKKIIYLTSAHPAPPPQFCLNYDSCFLVRNLICFKELVMTSLVHPVWNDQYSCVIHLKDLSVQFSSVAQSCPNSLRLHGLQHARPPCPSPTS